MNSPSVRVLKIFALAAGLVASSPSPAWTANPSPKTPAHDVSLPDLSQVAQDAESDPIETIALDLREALTETMPDLTDEQRVAVAGAAGEALFGFRKAKTACTFFVVTVAAPEGVGSGDTLPRMTERHFRMFVKRVGRDELDVVIEKTPSDPQPYDFLKRPKADKEITLSSGLVITRQGHQASDCLGSEIRTLNWR